MQEVLEVPSPEYIDELNTLLVGAREHLAEKAELSEFEERGEGDILQYGD